MKFIKKYNIYVWIFLISLLIMIVSSLYETNIFYIIKEYIFNPEYREMYISNSEIPIDFELNLINIVKFELENYQWNYDYMVIWGTNIFQLIIPVIASISGIIFYNKNQTINKMVVIRQKKYIRFIFKESCIISIKVSIALFIAFLVFFITSILISKNMTNPNITRTFLQDIIGNEFYKKYTILYYFIDGLIRLFIIPMIYSFSSCALSLFLKNSRQVFIIPIAYYYILSLISLGLSDIFYYGIYLSPILIMVTGDYSNINSFGAMLLPILITTLSLIGMTWKGKKIEI